MFDFRIQLIKVKVKAAFQRNIIIISEFFSLILDVRNL